MRILVLPLLATGLACTTQTPILPQSAPHPKALQAEVPLVAGSLTGRVFNDSTGLPLAAAMVRIVGSARGALTDSVGVFRVVSLWPGPLIVRALRIGYAPREDTIAFNTVLGARHSVRLRPVTLHLGNVCACDPVMARLRFRVLEGGTGNPIHLPSILAVNLNTGEDWTFGRQPTYTAGGWAEVHVRVGPNHMVVAAPGYRPWIRSRIEVDTKNGPLEVRLQTIGRD